MRKDFESVFFLTKTLNSNLKGEKSPFYDGVQFGKRISSRKHCHRRQKFIQNKKEETQDTSN